MTEDETKILNEIVDFVDKAARSGNGDAHIIYVKLRDFIEGKEQKPRFQWKKDKVIVAGFHIPENIVESIKNGNSLEGAKELRQLYGLELPRVKAIVDQIKNGNY